jgi:hypothetical protein
MSEKTEQTLLLGASDRTELVATIIMAMAAILTAWTGFQSAKWSGEQAKNFSQAGASRTESARFDNRAQSDISIDVATFVAWLEAVDSDVKSGAVPSYEAAAEPTPGTLSGFIFGRLREEFRPAFDAWLAAFVTDRTTAPATPFDMEEYVVADAVEAERLVGQAQDFYAAAGENNETSDRYVLTTVLFALVLFFAGISSKLNSKRNQTIMVGMASFMFVAGVVIVFLLPIHALIG